MWSCVRSLLPVLFLYIYRLFVFVLFFFFKQKTAYEMRISDWSSDVCSSDLFGAAPHADAGFLTLLPQAAVPGLEIATQSGKWIPAPVRPGEILVNGGRLLARFSNGRFLATPHRVVASLPRDRYSIPLFYNPNFDTVIEPLDTCVSAEQI